MGDRSFADSDPYGVQSLQKKLLDDKNDQNANAKQIQAVYHYERAILNAHIEVINQISKMENYSQSFATKIKEVILPHF